ncbi:MAG: GspH/FimT family pseudopilin [Proteobacteria bacterium]|nr:GspH/FimT family pseudopilin [Pseudomonadota bacterium]
MVRTAALPTRAPRTRRARGLTLIELMIGLGIMAVLMSLAVPSFAAYLQRARLKAAAQTLELDLREARYEAARRGVPLYLNFQGGGTDWCYAVATTPGCDCRQTAACRLKAARATDLRGVQLQEPHALRFDPATGNPDAPGTAAVWTAAGGERVQVSVNAMGRPVVCMLDGTLPPFGPC